MINNQTVPTINLTMKHIKKALLVVVEVVAVIGLLLVAFQFWQMQQTLHEDLNAAQEIQAVMQEDRTDAPDAAMTDERLPQPSGDHLEDVPPGRGEGRQPELPAFDGGRDG